MTFLLIGDDLLAHEIDVGSRHVKPLCLGFGGGPLAGPRFACLLLSTLYNGGTANGPEPGLPPYAQASFYYFFLIVLLSFTPYLLILTPLSFALFRSL